jgi:hypothetical protein
MRKVVVLVAAFAALAVAGSAQALTLTYLAPYASETETVVDSNNDGAPELVLVQGTLQTPAGEIAGHWEGRVEFLAPGLANLFLTFRYPFGIVYSAGTFNPEEAANITLQAVGIGKIRWVGTVVLTELADATQVVFQSERRLSSSGGSLTPPFTATLPDVHTSR